jgi:K(+)-stimulated pyrophosphate-energized sodium pump
MAVAALLKGAGVAEDKIELKKPEQAQADGPAHLARRVEVMLN